MNFDDRRDVNRALGKQIKIGIFDTGQISIVFVYALIVAFVWMFFSLSLINSIIFWFVLSFPTILLLGNKPWKVLRRAVPCPQVMRCGVHYQRILPLSNRNSKP
jgi:hypothetical protein